MTEIRKFTRNRFVFLLGQRNDTRSVPNFKFFDPVGDSVDIGVDDGGHDAERAGISFKRTVNDRAKFDGMDCTVFVADRTQFDDEGSARRCVRNVF